MTKKSSPTHDPQFCRAELERYAAAVDLDLSELGTGDTGPAAEVVGYMVKGWLTVSEDGETITYTLRRGAQKGTTVTFGEPDGACMRALDKGGPDEHVKRLHAFGAAMIGQPESFMSKLKWSDLEVIKSIARMFLA